MDEDIAPIGPALPPLQPAQRAVSGPIPAHSPQPTAVKTGASMNLINCG